LTGSNEGRPQGGAPTDDSDYGDMVALTTSIHTLADLVHADLDAYDGIYLGNPFGADDAANLLHNIPDLKAAVARLKSQQKRVCVSTDCLPRVKDLSSLDKLVDTAVEMGADAVEVHNLGALLRVRKKSATVPIHVGGLANLYNAAAVQRLASYGVTQVRGSVALSLAELKDLKDPNDLTDARGKDLTNHGPVEIEILVHGRMVLGVRESVGNRLTDKGDTVNDTPSFEPFGRAILSAKEVSLLPHLETVLKHGLRRFRIENLPAHRDAVSLVGQTYRQALNQIQNGEAFTPIELEAKLRPLSKNGFCNGTYFGTSGAEYVTVAEAKGDAP